MTRSCNALDRAKFARSNPRSQSGLLVSSGFTADMLHSAMQDGQGETYNVTFSPHSVEILNLKSLLAAACAAVL